MEQFSFETTVKYSDFVDQNVTGTLKQRKTHGKELVTDPVYEFEKIRNTPIKYNREIWTDTVQAMDKLAKIRKDREDRFFMRRMKRAEHDKKEIIKKNLIRHEQLISDPKIREKVDKWREERDEKRLLEEDKKNAKAKNVGIDGIIEDPVANEGDVIMKDKKTKKILTVRKKMKIKQKERLEARRKNFKKK